jgi:hypothetical protein
MVIDNMKKNKSKKTICTVIVIISLIVALLFTFLSVNATKYSETDATIKMYIDGLRDSDSRGSYEYTINGTTHTKVFYTQKENITIYCDQNNPEDCILENPNTLRIIYIALACVSVTVSLTSLIIIRKTKNT